MAIPWSCVSSSARLRLSADGLLSMSCRPDACRLRAVPRRSCGSPRCRVWARYTCPAYPDPGHQSPSGLEPVLSVIPAGARVIHEDRVEPRWDSCDGEQSTYGWDPAVVDADFSTGAA